METDPATPHNLDIIMCALMKWGLGLLQKAVRVEGEGQWTTCSKGWREKGEDYVLGVVLVYCKYCLV